MLFPFCFELLCVSLARARSDAAIHLYTSTNKTTDRSRAMVDQAQREEIARAVGAKRVAGMSGDERLEGDRRKFRSRLRPAREWRWRWRGKEPLCVCNGADKLETLQHCSFNPGLASHCCRRPWLVKAGQRASDKVAGQAPNEGPLPHRYRSVPPREPNRATRTQPSQTRTHCKQAGL